MNAVKKEDSKSNFYQPILYKLNYISGTNKGLITFIIFLEVSIFAFLSSFSEPIVQFLGSPIIPIELDETERVGRIIMLYHAMAIPFIAVIVFYVLEICEVRESVKPRVKWPLFFGSVITSLCGIAFAYIFPHNWLIHGLFLFGLSLVFYSGVLLFIGVFPTKDFPDPTKNKEVPYFRGINLEQFNLMLVTICLLISTVIGAIAGSYFGQEMEAFLAEDINREEHDIFERMIISHLHIMVALVAAAVLLVIFRYSEMSGKWYRISLILMIPGTIIVSIGAWLVVTGWERAHMVINFGSMFLLTAALILALFGWNKTSKEILGSTYESSSWLARALVILKEPTKFGLYFQFFWVNFVVTLPGVYVAINLRTKYRTDPYLEVERIFNVGHWHVLATVMAVIILLLSVDFLEITGKIRDFIGGSLTIGSIITFGFSIIYMLRTPDMDVDWAFYVIDIGITLIVLGVFAFCLHQLREILKGNKEVRGVDH